MSEQSQPGAHWSKGKIAGVIVLAVMILAGSLYGFAAAKVREAAGTAILTHANNAVNGAITVGGIDLSVLGAVEVKQVKMLDAGGRTLASADRVLIGYRWSDLLHGQLGPQLITGVSVEKPELWVEYAPDKLNWDGLLKPQAETTGRFGGIVTLKEAQVHVKTPFFAKTVTKMNGTVDCAQNDLLKVTAAGKAEQADIAINGQWGAPEQTLLTITAKKLDLAALGLTEADDPIQLTKGLLDDATVELAKDKTGMSMLKTLSGRFSSLETAGAVALTQGAGKFAQQGNVMVFTETQALYKGQAVSAAGQVATSADNTKTLDFSVQMPAGDPAVILNGLQASGPLVVQATLTGSALSPVLAGTFSFAGLPFGDMAVSGISGAFSYAGQTLLLSDVSGSMAGGAVSAAGEVYPETGRFNLGISGSGLDSSRLTTKDVKGPLSLSGTAVGDASGALAQGSFVIQGGQAYGISFQRLRGDFIKRGAAEAEIRNMAVTTALGTFYPDQLSKDVMEQLQNLNLPVTKEALEDEVKQQVTNKLLQKLFR